MKDVKSRKGGILYVVKDQRNKRIGTEELHDAIEKGFVKIYHVKDELFVNRFMGKLHRGELEVIAGAGAIYY